MHSPAAPGSDPDAGATRADLMVGLSAAINSNLDLRSVLQAVTDAATAMAGADFGGFFYTDVDSRGATYRIPVLSGSGAHRFRHLPPPRITGLFVPTFTGTETLRIDDVETDPRFGGLPDGHPPLRSYLSTPVVGRNGTIGALLFGHAEAARFGPEVEKTIREVAAHAAVAVENARLFAAETSARKLAEERTRGLELLQDVTSRLATALTEDDALVALEESLRLWLGIQRMGVDRIGDARAVGAPPDGRHVVRALRGGSRDGAAVPAVALPRRVGARAHDQRRGPPRARAHLPRPRRPAPGVEAVAAVPLRVSGAPYGSLVMTWTQRFELGRSEQRLLSAVAEQLAGTLERTRLYAAEARAREDLGRVVAELTEASRTLQRSLLPDRLPDTPDVSVAVRYVPGAAGAEVGGDWYDVVVAPDGGRITLVIGDVQGHNISAAAVMGRVSTALNAYLLEGHDLDAALDRLNPIVEQSGLLVTCCLVSLNPGTGEVRMARAGHPLPIFYRDGAGGPGPDDAGGPPLGVDASDAGWEVTTGTAQAGDRLVLFTDGLVERRGGDQDDCLETLLRTVATSTDVPTEEVADRILQSLRPRTGDDVALLVAELLTTPSQPVARLTVTAADEVAAARAFTRDRLRAWGMSDAVDSATLLVSELVTNALVHAQGPAVLEVSVTEAGVRLAVTDSAVEQPSVEHPDEDDDHGRGVCWSRCCRRPGAWSRPGPARPCGPRSRATRSSARRLGDADLGAGALHGLHRLGDAAWPPR